MSRKPNTLALLTALSMAAASCGDTSLGRAPGTVRIDELVASSGAGSLAFGGYLHSDVLTNVTVQGVTTPTVYNDVGRVTFSLVLKDPGAPGITNVPSDQNTVQMTHYRVVYRRTDGRNVQGVDVPYAFDSGMTILVPANGSGQNTFDIVRVSAKKEAPLAALAVNGQTLDVIADVTFYGHDMHNNAIAVTGSVGVTFANFGDPSS